MNLEQLTERLVAASKGRKYTGSISKYAIKVLMTGKRNYSTFNLYRYCENVRLKVRVVDMRTNNSFEINDMDGITRTINRLMEKYDIRNGDKIAVLPPYPTIKMLLECCSRLNCEIVFE